MGYQQPAAAAGPPTGFIIDAKGLQVVPAMVPAILDLNGQAVYSSAHVSREYAVQYGVVGYAKDVAAASANDRVGANPLIVKGVKASGKGNANVVVDNSAALRLREQASQGLLQQGRVVIVVD